MQTVLLVTVHVFSRVVLPSRLRFAMSRDHGESEVSVRNAYSKKKKLAFYM